MIKGGVWKNTEDEILKAAVMKYGLNQVRAPHRAHACARAIRARVGAHASAVCVFAARVRISPLASRSGRASPRC
jgi:hypothetical protein